MKKILDSVISIIVIGLLIIDSLMPILIIGFFIIFPIVTWHSSYDANKKDEAIHRKYIGKNIVINNDTVTVLNWHSGINHCNNIRGYVLSNGMTVDELIVYNNIINNK